MSYEDFFFLLLFNDTSMVMSEVKGHGGCVKGKGIRIVWCFLLGIDIGGGKEGG